MGGCGKKQKSKVNKNQYTLDITGLISSEKLSVPCISQPSFRPFSMMILQPYGCEKSFVISIPIEIVKLTSREAKNMLGLIGRWLLSQIISDSMYLNGITVRIMPEICARFEESIPPDLNSKTRGEVVTLRLKSPGGRHAIAYCVAIDGIFEC
jgi:hypothetical protein